MRRLLVVVALLLACSPAIAQSGSGEVKDTTREHEILADRPSGFWTSNRRAKEPYRWRLLAIGGGLVVLTGLLTWRLVHKKK